MKAGITFLPLVILFVFMLSCTSSTSPKQTMKYPRKPADDSERRSGPAMLLYEAAEKEADPNNVIVVPPEKKGDKNAQ